MGTKARIIKLSEKEYISECIYTFGLSIVLLSIYCFFAFTFGWWPMFLFLLMGLPTPRKYQVVKEDALEDSNPAE